ncbi:MULTISPECIES: amidohydrolase family protein [unclassified Ensifer]|uniref:amidohydrolase family protein n=1 Tax=unclassified Ensifer TaxID=2633371 RepID=UPI000812E4D0|nr:MULTISPECIES: amidohydrolase family protein [unclassified Ensifer]OCP03061.1 hydrolase [Ensifer sp. LC14]OCP08148.1 hydrolase [Ensifer sp. LC11]OCP08819.1 hydrolase [Ensifer sp. LC13]OCP32188.1 hydrolase [Ensifer sp. LC499]
MKNALLIENATVLTMDAGRRVLERGHVLVEDGRISSIGEGSFAGEWQAERIDASGMVAMPGLIDTHAHAGHMLTKGLGSEVEDWMEVTGRIYATATDPEFWAAEAALSAAERIKCGTTTAALLFGGGPDIMRSEAAEAAEAHLTSVAAMGVREILAIGPNRPGQAHVYRQYTPTSHNDIVVSPDRQIEVATELVDAWAGRGDRLRVVFSLPVFDEQELRDETVYRIACKVRDLAREKGVLLVQDGHRDGSIAANDARLGLFDGRSLLAHCIDLTEADRLVLQRTDAKVAHNPSALMSLYGRCPAPELMGDGVTVSLGTDAAAPDRSFDMFRNMFQAHRYHARHFADDAVLPPLQLLEMATIGGARALMMEDELGSLEAGKRADIILVNMRQPHLWPPHDPVQRLARYANGADVDTTIVGGQILMRGRRLVDQDEDAILDRALSAFHLAMARAGLSERA